ncbi:MAG: radical SAM protein [Geobacteraceae bacterium]|nr:radical SAM protein [Geobacteraceae bacterium]
MQINRVLFIQASFHADDGRVVKADRKLDRMTAINVAELGIPLLAAYTPKHIQVEMVDDALEEIPWETPAEVIAISAKLIQRSRAIELATYFRTKGKIVVLGGYLATLSPEGLSDYFDALCMGDGDLVWPQMLADIENNCLKERYRADHSVQIDSVPVPRYDLLAEKSLLLSMRTSYPVQATRGCPHDCSYCCITNFYQRTYRYRPVAQVIRDIKAHGSRYMHFVDDNLMANRAYAKELFREMAKLDVLWGTQTAIDIAGDDELLDLAYAAGCRIVMVGMETISQKNLSEVNKGWGDAAAYRNAIRKIQNKGIGVHALIVLGMPHDSRETFTATVDFLVEAGAAAAEFFIFTPYPGTPVGDEYLRAGKIIDFDLTHYREPYVVFRHERLTSREIQDAFWGCLEQFYSLRNIYRRLKNGGLRNRKLQIVLNLYYLWKIKRRIVPTHFQRGNFLKMSYPSTPEVVNNE